MKKKKAFWLGVLIGISGIILHSSKAIMIKLAYQYQVDALSMLFFRMLFAFPFYLAIAVFYRSKKEAVLVQRNDYLWVVFFGILGYYLSSYFDFLGLMYIKASLERIILFIYPTIVLLFNQLFLKQQVTKSQVYAIVLSYLGIIIAFGNEVVISGSDTYLGGFFILLCAIAYAAYLSGSGFLIPKFGVVKFTTYAMLISCICVFIHFGVMHEIDIFNYPWQVYVLGVLIAVFATVIPSFLVSASIELISSSNFAVIASVGPISTIILASIFLNESLTWLQLFGAMVVIIGVLYVSLKKQDKA